MTFLTAITTFLLLGVQTGKPTDFVVMQFSASWCEPCKEMQPSMEQLAQKGWIVRNVDVDLEKSIVQRMKVTHLPTLIILRNGQEVDRITGVHTPQELAALLPSSGDSSFASHNSMASQSRGEPNAFGIEPFPMLQKEPARSTHAAQHIAPQIAPQKENHRDFPNETVSVNTGVPLSNPSSESPQSRISVDPMSTTVRIKTEDDNHISFGTGTMIDQMNGEVLVLTCGHLFRDLTPSTRLTVEAPVNGKLGQFAGTVVDFKCDETDIGLLSFKPGTVVPVATLVPRGTMLREGEPVASIGCDGGADPTRRDSKITKLNRYLGPSNVEVANAPVQGRSGGGLFNSAGQLIGVCYAADKELDEGLYSGPEVVYTQLARLGLTRLYDAPANSPISIAGSSSAGTHSPLAASVDMNSENVFPDQLNMNRRNIGRSNLNPQIQQTVDQATQATRSNPMVVAAAAAAFQSTTTITATIRDASGRERTVTIPNAPPALLKMLDSAPQTAQNSAPGFNSSVSLMR